MALMRVCSLLPPLLLLSACRPATVVEPSGPVAVEGYTGPLVDALEPTRGSAPAPAPTPTPAPEPPPTWEWALALVPTLAEHTPVDPGPAALARFVGWFDDGTTPRVYLLHEDRCHAVEGSMSGEGFHGRWRVQETIEGDERQVSGMSLEISLHGITESGPGGVIYTRDEHGKWQETGGFGTGCFDVLVDRSMSAADDRSVTFAGYHYGLVARCSHFEGVQETCEGGGTRTCERCGGVSLEPKAPGMGWGRGSASGMRVGTTPVDCTEPCPPDEWTPRLPRISAALTGRTFVGVLGGQGPSVFRSAKGCARELRRRRAAAATPAE
jgi:hypothetical protein